MGKALVQLVGGLVAGLDDQFGRILDQAAGGGKARIEDLVGLLAGFEDGFVQAVDALLGRLGRQVGGLAGVGGGDAELFQGAARFLDQVVAGVGGHHRDVRQGGVDTGLERRALVFRNLAHRAEAFLGSHDDVAQHVDAARGGLAQVDRGDAGDGQGLGQLGALVLDVDGEVFLVGAQRQGGGDEGGALLAQIVLDAADLVDDARAGGFQALGLPVEVGGRRPRRLVDVMDDRQHLGRTRRQRRFGLMQLCLGQVGGVGDHAGLAVDRFDDALALLVQAIAHLADGAAFLLQRTGDRLGGAAGDLGGVGNAIGLGLQLLRQVVEVIVGQAHGAHGVIHLGAQRFDQVGRLDGRLGGGGQHGVGQGRGALGLARQGGGDAQGKCRGEDQADRKQGQKGQDDDPEGRDAESRQVRLGAQDEGAKPQRPQQADDGNAAPEHHRRAAGRLQHAFGLDLDGEVTAGLGFVGASAWLWRSFGADGRRTFGRRCQVDGGFGNLLRFGGRLRGFRLIRRRRLERGLGGVEGRGQDVVHAQAADRILDGVRVGRFFFQDRIRPSGSTHFRFAQVQGRTS